MHPCYSGSWGAEGRLGARDRGAGAFRKKLGVFPLPARGSLAWTQHSCQELTCYIFARGIALRYQCQSQAHRRRLHFLPGALFKLARRCQKFVGAASPTAKNSSVWRQGRHSLSNGAAAVRCARRPHCKEPGRHGPLPCDPTAASSLLSSMRIDLLFLPGQTAADGQLRARAPTGPAHRHLNRHWEGVCL